MKNYIFNYIFFIVIILVIAFLSYFLFTKFNPKLIETYVGDLRVANEIDNKRAAKYVLKKFCEMGGYKWVQGPEEFTYDCKHTKKSCEAESIYPTPKTPDAIPKYYEWRDNTTKEYRDYANQDKAFELSKNLSGGSASEPLTDPDGICLIGNEAFRDFCEKETLKYDPSVGSCVTTKKYCNDRLLAYCDGDCYEPPFTNIFTKVVGSTISRTFGSTEFLTTQAICDAKAAKK